MRKQISLIFALFLALSLTVSCSKREIGLRVESPSEERQPIVPPWESRADNNSQLGEGVVPMNQVDSAPPEPGRAAMEPLAVPDPIGTDPSLHNIGGVNGGRPPRNL